jgi:hypothetical protein
MVVRWTGLFLIGIMLISGVGSALIPDTLTISTDKPAGWLVANGMDNATITVRALNQSTNVSDVEISFSVTDTTLGTIIPEKVSTNQEGYASAVLTVKNKSGLVTVSARNSTLINTTSLTILAPYPDETYIDSSVDWLVANGSDRATITVSAFNNSPSFPHFPVAGLNTTFSVNNSIYGSISPITVKTDSQGNASTVFITGKKSGVARIFGNLTHLVNGEPYILLNVSQKIDHDTPYRISEYTYSNEMEVANISPIGFSYSDRWGNLIDNRRIAEEVSISITSPSPEYNATLSWDNSTFSTNITIPVDGNGTTNGFVRMNTRPGWNILIIHPFMYTPAGQPAIPDKYLTIEGVPGKPARIEADFNPSTLMVPADGSSKFDIRYSMWDKWGNLVQNRSIWVETSIPGEEHGVGTNSQGLAMLTYGPKSSIGVVWINATALDNILVTNSTQVWFVSQEAVDMELTANPQTMPSHDVVPTFSSQIVAKLVDVNGNPDINREVTFTLDQPTYDKGIPTTGPSLSAASANTDEYGNAIVQFIPGAFEINSVNTTATGRCNITATWGTISQTVPVVWKNYPYLSAETYPNKKIIAVNETVDVTIILKADGWALQPKPVDVVIVTDLAGGIGGGQLLVDTRKADLAFVNNAKNTTYIGLASFGSTGQLPYSANASSLYNQQGGVPTATKLFNPYGNVWDYCLVNPTLWDESHAQRPDSILVNGTPHYTGNWNTQSPYIYFNSYSDATIDRGITSQANKANLITTINNYQSKGGTDYAVGINAAMREFQTSGIPGHAKAIIIMGDGIPMMAPIAPGSLESYWPSDWYPRQNLGWEDESDTAINAAVDSADRAKAQGITIYAAGFKLGPSPGYVDNDTLLKLVSSPDCYYYTPDTSKLDQVLLTIQGRIQTEAGVNTTSDLPYNQVEINSVLQDNSGGNPKLDYVYVPNYSTWVDMNNITGGRPAHTPAYPYSFDQSSEWNSTRMLSFDIGTVYLNQEWVAKYRLRVNESGNINVIGPDSIVSFNDGKTLVLPNTYITAIANMTQTNITTNILQYINISEVTDTSGPESQLFKTFIISSLYTGTHNVTEDYFIVTYDGRRWYVGSRVLTPLEAAHERTFRMRVVDLPAGWRYLDAVANVYDAPGPARIPPAPIGQVQMDPNKIYIRLS